MAPNHAEDESSPDYESLIQLARTQRGHLSPARAREGRYGFVAALWRTRRATSRSYLLAAACLLALVTWGALRARPSELQGRVVLTYAVEGGAVDPAGKIEVPENSLSRIHFSDGTELRLAGRSRAVVEHVDALGARVTILEGSAHVAVVHAPEARWLFDAGPFRVTVTGTAFDMRWQRESEQLDVQMIRGSVSVDGPLSETPILLRSRQHLTIRVRDRETIIRELSSSTAEVAPPPTEENRAEPASRADRESSEPRARAARTRPRKESTPEWSEWPARVQQGLAAEVLREAEQYGFPRALEEANGPGLAALADAARYGRRTDLARAALLALRRRFSSSAEALDAAFLLGRLEESEHQWVAARRWYDEYLAGSGRLTYASEALGRKLLIAKQLQEERDARELAAEYLARFPQGTYASLAREIEQRP